MMSRVIRCILGGLILLCLPLSAAAAPPPLLPIQGYLTDDADRPLDGTYKLAFALYDASTQGTRIYTTSQPVTVGTGSFTVYLGDTTPLDLSLLHTNNVIWLEITVEQDCGADSTCNTGTLVNRTLAPRLQVGTTAFAASASFCGDADLLGGKASTAFAAASHTHNWSDVVSGMPSGFADGIDNDTQYSGTNFATSGQACGGTQKVVGINSSGALTCGADVDTTVDAYTKTESNALYLPQAGGNISGDLTVSGITTLGIHRVSCPPGSTVSSFYDCACPAGEVATGGGGYVLNSVAGSLRESWQPSAGGWRVGCISTSGSVIACNGVYAMCARIR